VAHLKAVIACGNPNRGDDGAGGAVLGLLRQRLGADVCLLDAGTDGMAVMFAARGCETLIIVDACRSGSEPGAIFEVPGDELAAEAPPALSTHDFRWQHALYAGRRIFGDAFPRDVSVLLIEAESFDFSAQLSAAVARAVALAAERICARLLPAAA
jgi:hydrogenase maturation protease